MRYMEGTDLFSEIAENISCETLLLRIQHDFDAHP
jgi:hypothetical protein